MGTGSKGLIKCAVNRHLQIYQNRKRFARLVTRSNLTIKDGRVEIISASIDDFDFIDDKLCQRETFLNICSSDDEGRSLTIAYEMDFSPFIALSPPFQHSRKNIPSFFRDKTGPIERK